MKTIKNIFKSKITYAVLACLLLVGIFAGLTTLASNDPVVTIVAKNVNHAESARLVYRVQVANVTEQDLINNASALKMHFWTTEPTAPNATPEYTVIGGTTDGDDANGAYVLFESYDIAPKAMTNSVYCVAEYNGVYSDVCRYSVFEYLCEASMTANADQKALYTAMNDYIKYAQMYLGVDGDEFPSPDNLGYVKLTNCYILVNGEQVRDGVVPLGYYEIFADFEYARFYNHNGAICEYTGTDNKWGVNLTKSDKAKGYTAYEAAKLVINPVDNAEIVRVTPSTVDGNKAYVTKTAYGASAAPALICNKGLHSNDHYILIPAIVEGKSFSHWASTTDASVVSTSSVLVLDSYIADAKVPGSAVELDVPVVPVFVDESVGKVHDFSDTDIYKDGELEGKVNVEEIYDESGKLIGFTADKYVAGDGTGSEQVLGSIVEGTTALKRISYAFDIKIESSAANYTKPVLGDFFGTDVSYNCHTQGYLYMGGTYILSYGFFPLNDPQNVNADVSAGYYMAIGDHIGSVKNIVRFNTSAMKYGAENHVEFIIDVEAVDGGYKWSNILVYVNGVFAGSGCLRTSDGKTNRVYNNSFAYDNKVKIAISTPKRPKAILTVKNFTLVEFN